MMLLKACIMILSADVKETNGRNKFYDLNGVFDSGIGGAKRCTSANTGATLLEVLTTV